MPNPRQSMALTSAHSKGFKPDYKLIRFAEANGIPTDKVPFDSVLDVDFNNGVIHYEEFVFVNGTKKLVYNGEVGRAERVSKTVPLKVEPQEMGY